MMIEFKKVRQKYQVGRETIEPLVDVSFSVAEGEFVSIQGASGAENRRF
ncbi:MAG: hypothetical protein R3C11_08655 [Planctomycetaceae bacterium]